MLDHQDHLDHPGNQEVMALLVRQDRKAHQDQMDRLAKMGSLDNLVHQAHQVRRARKVFARNTVQSMVVFSSKMEPVVKNLAEILSTFSLPAIYQYHLSFNYQFLINKRNALSSRFLQKNSMLCHILRLTTRNNFNLARLL